MIAVKLPSATIFLAAAICVVYAFLSGGLLYVPRQALLSLSSDNGSALGFVSYIFVHVGIQHLVGNLLPLLVFGAIFELSSSAFDVFALFFVSGVVSSVAFSSLNPGVSLVGASAAISGLMGAAVAARPSPSFPLIIAIPLVFNFFVSPALSAAAASQQAGLLKSQNQLSEQLGQLVAANKTAAASQVAKQLSGVNLQEQTVQEGVAREASTPTDFLVHMIGVVCGVCYVFVRRRDLFESGAAEFMLVLSALWAPVAKAIRIT